MVYLEAQGESAVFSSLQNGPHPLYIPLIMLTVDCILYLLLAIYLDQVLPGKNSNPLQDLPFTLNLLFRVHYVNVASVLTQVSME